MQNYSHPTADQQDMQHNHSVSNWKHAHTIWSAKHAQSDFKSNEFQPHTNLTTENRHRSSYDKKNLHTNRTQIEHKLNLQHKITHTVNL